MTRQQRPLTTRCGFCDNGVIALRPWFTAGGNAVPPTTKTCPHCEGSGLAPQKICTCPFDLRYEGSRAAGGDSHYPDCPADPYGGW